SDISQDQINATAADLFRKNFPHLRELTLIDSNGHEMLHRYIDTIVKPEDLADRSNDPAVQAALQGLGRRGSVQRAPDGVPVFTLLLPLRDSAGRIDGVVGAEMSAQRIVQMLRSAPVPPDSIVYMVDNQRHIMLADRPGDFVAPAGLGQLFSAPDNANEYI